ncbi:hypothetical protein GJ688_11480 [Heliobacillus mobilis]|uniref:SLH domain-containing protein n=1 Tax=Heliobacterium mobile TaxID=28064 RepID=A0A6I3SKV9_HELMO|nr:S-layer homology domain-containing protein [Heliobacterium mobile]MTV49598.1 hypothetical protein [Heliobacterium mobile]
MPLRRRVTGRILAGLLTAILVMPSTNAFAESSPLTMEGGIANEYDYQEYVFLSGKPILMTGTFKVTVNGGQGGDATTKITYTLKDQTGKNKLDRNATYVEKSADREDKNQTVRTSQLDKLTETATIDGVKYTLDDARLSKSVLVDKHPVTNFYAGNWEGRKIYSVNKTEGRLVVDTSGRTVGYDHNWGRSETQTMTQTLQYTPENPKTVKALKTAWEGQLDYTTNLTTDREISYQSNEPSTISFSGGYLLNETGASTTMVNYNLPTVKTTTTDGTSTTTIKNAQRNQGNEQFSLQTNPKLTRMYVPNYDDIRGHWAESAIETLAGVKAWDSPSGYFGPAQPITRLDFARATVQALGIVSPSGPNGMIAYTAGYPNLPEPGKKAGTSPTPVTTPNRAGYNGATGTPRKANTTAPSLPFTDLSPNMSGFDQVKLAYAEKLMDGISYARFDPYGLLTREQAAALIVRGLGLDNLAPSGFVSLPFADDNDISPWARDSVYVARKLNILSGDNWGYFRPQESMTRAEAAALLMRAITFLQNDLKSEYRDYLMGLHS